MPALAVAIPCRNRQDHLTALLSDLRHQADAGELAVVCADDASAPPLRVPPDVRIVRLETPAGPAAARNRAWHALEADWIWFLDDDVRPEAGAVAGVRAAIRAAGPEVGILEGPIREAPAPASRVAHPLAPRLPEAGPAHRMTASIVYRRAALASVDGFDDGFRHAACEDFDLAFRVETAGWGHRFVPAAVVRHAVHPPIPLGAWLSLRRRRRLAAVRLFTRHPGRFDPSWMGRLRPLVHRPGRPLTARVWLRFFVAEALLEAAGSRRPWRFAHLGALAWVAAGLAAAGVVRDYWAGCFDGSRYRT